MTEIVDAGYTPPNEAERGYEIGKEVVELERQIRIADDIGFGCLKGNAGLKALARLVRSLLFNRKKLLTQSLKNEKD